MVMTASTMLPIGTEAPDFSLPDTQGRTVSLKDFQDAPALLVIFLCNHCPFVKHVRSELATLAREYQQKGVAVVGINSNDVESYPDDSPARMKEEVEQGGYTFPYLFDETQEVAKAYRAACTPDFFVFDKNRKLVYRGQMDDSRPESGIPVTGKDLRSALDAVLEGKPVPQEQRPSAGCNIKWKKGNEPAYFGSFASAASRLKRGGGRCAASPWGRRAEPSRDPCADTTSCNTGSHAQHTHVDGAASWTSPLRVRTQGERGGGRRPVGCLGGAGGVHLFRVASEEKSDMTMRSAGLFVTSSWLVCAAVTPASAAFHLMQIEQVIGGVNGDATKQAIQLRMRSFGQNLLGPTLIRVFDANGENPIVVVDFDDNVSSRAPGARVLVASAGFAEATDPASTPDFVMTNLIPESYLAAGSLTFEDRFSVLWRVSWGGDAYTGSTTGSTTNDFDGEFGPAFPDPLPSDGTQALLFQGTFGAVSTNNADDYALTSGAAVFTNNAGNSFTVTAPTVAGDLDGDGDVDWNDYALFEACLGGPETAPEGTCDAPVLKLADTDGDGDVDLVDAARFAAAFGSGLGG